MSSKNMYSSAATWDGVCGYEAVNKTWAQMLAAPGTELNDYGNANYGIHLWASATSGWSHLYKGVFLFNAAELPTGSVITGGSFHFRHNSHTDAFGSSLVLANAPVTGYTSIVGADYALLNAVKVEHSDTRHVVSSLVNSTFYEFELNATALTTFKSLYDSGNAFELSMQYDWDFDEVEPTWIDSQLDQVGWTGAANATESIRPYLEIEYYVGSGYATITLTAQKATAALNTLTADSWTLEIFT